MRKLVCHRKKGSCARHRRQRWQWAPPDARTLELAGEAQGIGVDVRALGDATAIGQDLGTHIRIVEAEPVRTPTSEGSWRGTQLAEHRTRAASAKDAD